MSAAKWARRRRFKRDRRANTALRRAGSTFRVKRMPMPKPLLSMAPGVGDLPELPPPSSPSG